MKKGIVYIALAVLITSCDTLQQLTSITNLKNCNFALNRVDNVQVAGINVTNFNGFSATDLLNIAACVASKKIPVVMGVQVGVDNPGATTATVTRMEWLCTVDDKQLATGVVSDKYTVPAGGSVSIPLRVNMDAYELFSSSGVDAVKAFINSFSKENHTSSRVAVKVKPTVTVGSATVTMPNYITLISSK
ncbi:MAG: LEA type 2 family protein [Bacteroidales bacterium]|nr:LEA type 2 family protein [Bacteroidales bacterium]MBP5613590.1 LEA type 2 family protein [Bacteroidales bacterium]